MNDTNTRALKKTGALVLAFMAVVSMVVGGAAAFQSAEYDYEDGTLPSDHTITTNDNGNIAVVQDSTLSGSYNVQITQPDDGDGTVGEEAQQVMEVSESINTDGMRIEAEMYTTSTSNTLETHIVSGAGLIEVSANPSTNEVTVSDAGVTQATFSQSLSANTAYDLATEYEDDGTVTIYVDGSQVGQTQIDDVDNVDAAIVSDMKEGTTVYVDDVTVESLNSAPVADFVDDDNTATVEDGASTTLDASASADADSDNLTYAWDFDGDGNFDDASGETVSVAESSTGTYNYSVQVTDEHGATDTAQFTLDVVDDVSSGSGTTSSSPTFLNIPILYWVLGIIGVGGLVLLLADD